MQKKYKLVKTDIKDSKLTITTESGEKTNATQLLKDFEGKKIFLFEGQMGAGKTTFIKELCEEMGVVDIVNSPTFSIVNVYNTSNGQEIYHFDCYRLKNSVEALSFGAEEYLYSGNYCFVEWPEVISDILPDDCVMLRINIISETEREIVAQTE